MPRFSYVAINSSDKEITGVMDSEDAAEVEHNLNSQELMTITVSASD